MRPILALAVTATLSLVGLSAVPAQAEDNLVVVELFTSQGCAACPPADALMGELAERDDVIALALHVDYWDYIGWADVFASPQFTQRQHGYGHAAGSTVVYTPQMIIGGHDRVVGYRPMNVADLIQAHQEIGAHPVAINVDAGAGAVRVEATAQMEPPRPPMVVQVVTYTPHAEVEITRGERAGTVAHHYNIVTSWQIVAEWDGATPFSAEITPQNDTPHVVLVQEANFGRILGAARLN